MGKLIYSTITSLDCFVEDSDGAFDWATPDEDVFSFINQQERTIGTYLFGRRMYETMVYWETAATLPDQSAVEIEFTEMWKTTDKIVYSTTLTEPTSARTKIEEAFNPDAVAKLKATSRRDIAIGGPALASLALTAGLVDEIQLYLTPIVLGAGKRAFPVDTHLPLKLSEEKRFETGVVFLRFSCAS
jgi:dihydrofolate reductase